jgi:hypothetical protein
LFGASRFLPPPLLSQDTPHPIVFPDLLIAITPFFIPPVVEPKAGAMGVRIKLRPKTSSLTCKKLAGKSTCESAHIKTTIRYEMRDFKEIDIFF